jgi:acetylornithine deacetylase/succinyl-diaminopimelate desuccinylase-like protein
MANEFKPWLKEAFSIASEKFFDGKQEQYSAGGGSIPFVNWLQQTYPSAQFCVMGVLGPNSNAHGPNEFLHLDYCKRLTCAAAMIVSKAEKSE